MQRAITTGLDPVTDHVCQACIDRSKEGNWYPFQDVALVPESECLFHPTLANWRVWRTLATVQYFSAQPEGFRDRRAPTPITLDGGWVHRRNLEVIAFDYEQPFIDITIKEGLLEERDVDQAREWIAKSVRLTAKGDGALRTYIHAGRNAEGASAAQKWLAKLAPDADSEPQLLTNK